MRYVIGLDVATTSTKALLLDQAGAVVASTSSPYEYDMPRPRWTEQHPVVWWDAAVRAVRLLFDQSEVFGGEVDAVGLTGQMHGSVLLDTDGEVVRPAILWNDQRTVDECDEIRNRIGRQRLIEITGNDALTGFTAPKLLWVANHEPENWAKVATILLPKDYVRFRLTDVRAVDVSDGSGTILFDLARRNWSPEVLAALGIAESQCPTVFEGPEIIGRISSEAASLTGLAAGTPVAAGGGDQAANAVGVGAVTSGITALSLGTSGVVFAPGDRPTFDSDGRANSFCHATPDKWHMMSVMLSAAGSLRWLRDALAPRTSFEDLLFGAAEAGPGASGLTFLPYLSGERTPHNDPNATGAFVGLKLEHDLRHMTRAVLEGVAFGLRDGLDLMVAVGIPQPVSIRASGGGTKSTLWRQILADVLEADIDIVATGEGAAFGAGLLASVGAGHFDSVESAVTNAVEVETVAMPAGNAALYREGHSRYKALYPAMKLAFSASTDR
ncbi:MAG TPA: xylulokinase [Acidimicrobiia bacterium]